MADDYKVGYRRPPRHGQFKKGKSGNPRGRPRGRRGFATDLIEELMRLIVVTEGGKRKSITKQRALMTSLVNKALQGNAKAMAVVLGLMREFSLAHDVPEYLPLPSEQKDGIAFFEKLARDLNITVKEDDRE